MDYQTPVLPSVEGGFFGFPLNAPISMQPIGSYWRSWFMPRQGGALLGPSGGSGRSAEQIDPSGLSRYDPGNHFSAEPISGCGKQDNS